MTKRARLWDAASGKEIRRFQGHSRRVNSVAFSPDGKQVLTGSWDKTARLWDAASGKEIRRFLGHTFDVTSVAFSPDGKQVLTGSWDKTARLWDAASGKEIRRFEGHATYVNSVAFSSDGKEILTGTYDMKAQLWDAASGKEIRRFQGRSGVTSVAFSPDGKQVLTGGWDIIARLWDAASGKEIRRFEGHSGLVSSVAFSPDGRQVLTGSADHTAQLWDAASGKELRRFVGHSEQVTSAMFSPDGKQVLTGSGSRTSDQKDNTARLWDAASGKELRRFVGHSGDVVSVAFSPDGKQVLTGSWDKTARIWDAASGKEIRRFQGHSRRVTSVAFSPDGKEVLTGSGDKTARLWDAASGKELRRFLGHAYYVNSVAFSPDGKQALTGSDDNTARLWDAASGKELCTLVSFTNGEWAVVDLDGRFDASNGGDVEGLHWVVGNEPIELSQLKERYYDPGLLAKKLGFNQEPLRKVEAFDNPKMFPEVALIPAPARQTQFNIRLTNRGGGIGRVVVKINGKELTADARGARPDPNAATLTIPVELAGDPRLQPGQKNIIEVQAFNAEGYLRSRGMEFEVDDPRAAVPAEKPELWTLVVGVSRYQGGAINLRYAAKDAKDFAGALRIAGARLFGADNVHLTLLTSADPDGMAQASAPAKPNANDAPSRENIVAALKVLQDPKRIKPGDILVVYLAGHGVNRVGTDEGFYYLTCDAQSAELTDPAVRQLCAISDQELTAAIAKSPALKQVMILDTCHAGKLIDDMTAKRDIPSSEVRALERIKDRTGLHILAGCASDSGSYEASRYGQGVLTYSLLLGMRGAALKEDKFVDVGTLFNFAADRVPALAQNLGGIQRPVISSPKGSSFEIGEVTADDRKQIPLRRERPLVLRTVFQEEQSFDDVLDLAKKVDEQLCAVEVRGTQGGIVFVDARALPDGYRVAGRYRIDGEKVTVSVKLSQDKKRILPFTISGKTTAMDDLAARVVAETEKQINSQSSQTPAADAGK